MAYSKGGGGGLLEPVRFFLYYMCFVSVLVDSLKSSDLEIGQHATLGFQSFYSRSCVAVDVFTTGQQIFDLAVYVNEEIVYILEAAGTV